MSIAMLLALTAGVAQAGPLITASEPYCAPTGGAELETPLPTLRLTTGQGTEMIYHFALQRREDSHCNAPDPVVADGTNWLAILRHTEGNGWYLVDSMPCDVAGTFEETWGLATAALTADRQGFVLTCAHSSTDIYDSSQGPWTVRTQTYNVLGQATGQLQEKVFATKPSLGEGIVASYGTGTVELITDTGLVDLGLSDCHMRSNDILYPARAGEAMVVTCSDLVNGSYRPSQAHVLKDAQILASIPLQTSPTGGSDQRLTELRLLHEAGRYDLAWMVSDSGGGRLSVISDVLSVGTRTDTSIPSHDSGAVVGAPGGPIDAFYSVPPQISLNYTTSETSAALDIFGGAPVTFLGPVTTGRFTRKGGADGGWVRHASAWETYEYVSVDRSGTDVTLEREDLTPTRMAYPEPTFWELCEDKGQRWVCWAD